MNDRTIAMLALVLAVVAIVALAIHIVVPTPPAHQPNRFWAAWQRASSPPPPQPAPTPVSAGDGSGVAS